MTTLAQTKKEATRGVNVYSRLGDRAVQWVVTVLVALLVLFPTWPIIYQSFLRQPLYEAGQALSLNNYFRVVTNPGIWSIIGNTAIFMLGSTLVASLMGILLAVLLTRTDIPGRGLISWLVTVPYYVSALILAFAWAVMYGPQGFITVGARSLGLPVWNLYSMGGMIFVSALYFMPLTYLYCSSSLRLADPQLENAARIGGAKPLQVLMLITIPLIRPAILYSVLLTLVAGIELLSIPLVLGEKNRIDVLSTFLYRTAIQSGETDYGMLAVVALLIVAFVTLLVMLQNRLTRQERRFVTVGGKVSRARQLSLGGLRWPAAILVGLFVVLTILVPLAGIILQAFTPFLSPLVNPFTLLTLSNFQQAFEFETYRLAIVNSLFIATIGGLIATFFMAMCALLAYRSAFPLRGLVKYLALYPRAFPGTVIGIGFLWALLSIPAAGWLRNTVWILIIAYCMRYLPLGFSSVSPSILQISDELDRAARVSGASWREVIRHILLPLLRPALIATYLLLFITFLKEYSVALFLFARGSQVIGTTMLEVWAQGGPGPVAALAVVQLIIIAIVMWLSSRIPNVKLRE
ncbi:MAG: iron ABC transporter permease [Anaerolineales bacterium]|nr:iron ABC transporter permease [Anaerolineales bacterium]